MAKPKVSIEEYCRKLDSVSETSFARLAAYIDGEGCINISGSPRRGKSAVRTHEMKLTVTNTSLLLFDWIVSAFGGKVVLANSNYNKPNTKVCWRWLINEIQSEEILRRCLPYFIVKQEQARVALAFRDIKRRKFDEYRNRRVTPKMLEERDALQKRISELNSVKGFGSYKLSDPIEEK